MSITLNDLAVELGTDIDTIATHARELLRSGGQKVLTVGPDHAHDEVTCLTDHAAAAIRAQLSPSDVGTREPERR